MEKEKENFLDGFDAIGDFLINPQGNVTDSEDTIPELELEEVNEILDKEDTDKNIKSEKDDVKKPVEDEEDEEEEIEEIINKEKNVKTVEKDKELEEDDEEFESDITSFFQSKLGEKLGLDFGEDEKFSTVEELVDYFSNVVEEASKPQFANEEVEKYDKFVREGGNLREFYEKIHSGKIDVKKLDLESSYDQKLAIRESLKIQGLKDSIIEKRIERYDEAGVLKDEAEEAVDFLNEYTEKEEKKLLEETEKNNKLKLKQQQLFLENVEKTIKEMDSIGGVKLTDKQKKETLDYILKPTADGLTGFQKDYQSDLKNLIISAFFTKNKDIIIEKVKEKATTDAYKDLQKKIQSKKQRKDKNSSFDTSGSNVGLGLLGSSLLKKN